MSAVTDLWGHKTWQWHKGGSFLFDFIFLTFCFHCFEWNKLLLVAFISLSVQRCEADSVDFITAHFHMNSGAEEAFSLPTCVLVHSGNSGAQTHTLSNNQHFHNHTWQFLTGHLFSLCYSIGLLWVGPGGYRGVRDSISSQRCSSIGAERQKTFL